jgi:hypothetical protein
MKPKQFLLWKRHEKKLATFIHSLPLDSFMSCQLCMKVDNLGLCHIAFVSFPVDGPLRIETCRNVQCDIIIKISKDKFCAFSWFIFVNLSVGKQSLARPGSGGQIKY